MSSCTRREKVTTKSPSEGITWPPSGWVATTRGGSRLGSRLKGTAASGWPKTTASSPPSATSSPAAS